MWTFNWQDDDATAALSEYLMIFECLMSFSEDSHFVGSRSLGRKRLNRTEED
jgi:hypothetical protein